MYFKRFSGFTVISGLGWLLDFAVMASLVQSGVPVFAANSTGAFCGVTFVFFAAGRHIFDKVRERSRGELLIAYWLWQVVAIAVASFLIAGLSAVLLGVSSAPDSAIRLAGSDIRLVTIAGICAKAIVTPLTLVANFFFMRFLLESRRGW